MKDAVEISLGAVMYIPSFIKIGSDIQKLIGRHTQKHRQHDDRISLFSFFQNKTSSSRNRNMVPYNLLSYPSVQIYPHIRAFFPLAVCGRMKGAGSESTYSRSVAHSLLQPHVSHCFGSCRTHLCWLQPYLLSLHKC
jgi:hypothetical protein